MKYTKGQTIEATKANASGVVNVWEIICAEEDRIVVRNLPYGSVWEFHSEKQADEFFGL